IAVLLLADVSLGEGAGELFQPVVRVARSQPLTEQPTAAQAATAQPPAARSPVTGQPPATAQPTTTLPATQPATGPQGQQSLPSLGGRLFTREFGDITTDIRQRVGPRGNDTLPVDMARQDNLFVAP